MKSTQPPKCLLAHEFAPYTYCWGFLSTNLPQALEALVQWWRTRSGKITKHPFRASLREALSLFAWEKDFQRLLVSTHSSWVAYFGNDSCGAEGVHVSYLCKILRCRGLAVTHVPDTSGHAPVLPGAVGQYGMVQFELFADHPTDFLNYERTITVTKEATRWEFEADGTVQPFERTEKYKERRIKDRFTPEMLEEYCAALGIRLFDPAFYGPDGWLIEDPDTRRSLRESKS